MIVVDSSALIAIALAEPEAERLMHALHDAEALAISAATVTETLIVAMGRDCEAPITAMLDRFGIAIEPVTEARAKAAAASYRRYGKGWHAATLNYGDSFSYALAKEFDCPLLFIGNDFSLTDVKVALAKAGDG